MDALRIYDARMNYLGEIEDYQSLIWTTRWQEPGEFSLTCPATAMNVELLASGFFAWVRGEPECALVESVVLTEDEDSSTAEAGGRMASQLLAWRRIRGLPYRYSGRAGDALSRLTAACSPLVSPEDGIRLILAPAPEPGETVSFQATYRRLLTYLQRVCRLQGWGLRLRPDFTAKTLTLEAYAGESRPGVVFSDRFDNLGKAVFTRSREEYANVCFTLGKDGESDILETVGAAKAQGLARREALLESSSSREEGASMARFRAQLREQGEDALATQYAEVSSVECETDPLRPFAFGTDWRLGDVVTLRRSAWGLRESKRVTEVSVVREGGITTLAPVFGSPLPEKIEWEDSE